MCEINENIQRNKNSVSYEFSETCDTAGVRYASNKTLLSQSRVLLFNIKTLLISLVIMTLTGIIFLMKQSLLDAQFLEKISSAIQTNIYNQFSFNEQDHQNLCQNINILNISLFQQLNITEYHTSFVEWWNLLCLEREK